MMFTLYEVGGCVRDDLLGIKSKDIDYVLVPVHPYVDTHRSDCLTGQGNNATEDMEACGDCAACHFYADMRAFMNGQGYTIWQERPQFLTIRGKFPKGHVHAGTDADFVGARKEGPYTDGRRPDWVAPGSLHDDLSRRDFTVNALARSIDGALIDLFDGNEDIRAMRLRCVGSAEERIREDPLRAIRALRFMVTKGFEADKELIYTLKAEWLPPLLATVAANRKREELEKCFKADTLRTLELLWSFDPEWMEAVFSDGLRLKPTMES